MKYLVPHLWYDKEAHEAVSLYTSLFEDSAILSSIIIPDTPSGDANLVDFQLAGIRFQAISAGPYFKLNPSISLMVSCTDTKEVDRLYQKLIIDGFELMPLGEYSFSKHYAWIQDRYGLNWQLMYDENANEHQRIRPVLLFSKETCGKAENAIDYYVSIFKNAEKGYINHYSPGEAEDERAKLNYAEFTLGNLQFVAMDHGYGGDFSFNEAFSFIIGCDNQEEIDYYWDKLSFVPEAEQCGWVKDQFDVSWQIVPTIMDEILRKGSKEEIERVTEAFLRMKKFDLAELERAKAGQ